MQRTRVVPRAAAVPVAEPQRGRVQRPRHVRYQRRTGAFGKHPYQPTPSSSFTPPLFYTHAARVAEAAGSDSVQPGLPPRHKIS